MVDDFPEGKQIDPEVERFYLQVLAQQKDRSENKGYSDGAWMMLCLCCAAAFVAAIIFAAGMLCMWLM